VVDITAHDGVTQWRFSSFASRLVGFSASAFVTADGILIDTGMSACAGEFARLLDAKAIRAVMVTHHHEDHAGNLEIVARRGIPTWVPGLTWPLVTRVAPIGAYRRITWGSTSPLKSTVIPYAPDSLTPIAAPGHSADHHTIWHAATRTLFSADLFLGVAVRVVQRDEDPWAALASLDAAVELAPERMFCAHRGFVADPVAALRAKAAWTRTMIDSISSRIRNGDSDATILKTVLGGESLTGWASVGEYSRRNFIRAVRGRIAA
jgi:glyoxylase-like metal-dependent hydrolase (beta-lactamase superfamily II)